MLLESYKLKLISLADEIKINSNDFTIDPLELLGGSIAIDDFALHKLEKEKEVKDGETWVSNPDYGKWYKPWTFFTEEKGYWRTKYKTVKYVAGDVLAQEFFRPVQQGLYENARAAEKYAQKQSERIADRFKIEFKRLDCVLQDKYAELEKCATNEEEDAELLKEAESNLKWLKDIKTKMDSILEI